VKYSKVKGIYTVNNIKCLSSGNLYSFIIERTFSIVKQQSRIGMIIQLSAFCTPRMLSFQEQWLLNSTQSYISFFDDRPGKLFDGLEHIRVAICINEVGKNTTSNTFTTNYIKFPSETRSFLFENNTYIKNNCLLSNVIPKINKKTEQNILSKLLSNKKQLAEYFVETGKFTLFFHNAPQYFIRAHSFSPYFWNEKDGEKISVQNKQLKFTTEIDRNIVVSVLSSTIFLFWFIIQSDCRHLNMKEINEFPLNMDKMDTDIKSLLSGLAKKLEKDLKKNSYRKESNYKATGKVIYDEFYPKKSKSIIDEIDKVLAQHYGFTDEELDFIVNYDIKYRMGGELEGEEN